MFWVPLMYATSAVVVGLALPRLERRFFPDLTVGIDPGAALECFLLRVDKGIRRDFADADDQRDALELDRQGLGMAREQPGAASTTT